MPEPGGVCDGATSGTGNDVAAHVSFPGDHGSGSARIVITGRVSADAKDGAVITNAATVTLPADRLQTGIMGSASDTTTGSRHL